MRVLHFYKTQKLPSGAQTRMSVLPMILFFFAGIFPFTSLAQERPYYESRLNVEQKIVGSNLILCRSKAISENSTEPLFFEFKRRAYGTLASNVAASYLGLGQKQFRRSTLDGASVLAAQQLTDTSCVVLLERRDTLFLGEITPQLRLVNALPMPLSSSASASVLASATNGDGVRVLVLGAGGSVVITIAGKLFWWNRLERSNSADSNGEMNIKARIRAIDEYTVSDLITLNEFTESPNDPACALLRESGLRKDVVMLSCTGQELWTESLDVQRRTTLRRVSNFSVAACVEQGLTTSINIIRPKKPMLTTGVNAVSALVSFIEEPTRISVVALTQDNSTGKYYWEVVRMPFGAATYSDILWTFPDNVFVPISVTAVGNEFWCVFMNALYVMNDGNEPIATGRMNTRLQTTLDNTPHHYTLIHEASSHALYTVMLGRETLLVARDTVPLWWLRNVVRDVWLYGVLLAVLGIIIALLYIVRYQRRLLITLFGAPGADAMIILDDEGKLQSLNESARALMRIAQEAPMNRLFQFYCVDAGALTLSSFARETLKLRAQATKPITFQQAIALGENTLQIEGLPETEPHDYLFTAIPIQTRFGAMRGLMLTGKDITEELGKKKLGNWAQLAHDLQTNLAAIRLNAEKVASSTMSAEGQKILYQVNLIIKRVRDIITIGKSEDLEKRTADAADVCANVRKEFDDALFANVDFEVHAQHILFECDQLKLERALRNAVENGIRAMPASDGVISIRAWHEPGVVCFQVQDTGEGMSVDVQKNMMRKGFTTFGSQGGSGMGTMIMKYIIQLHGGEMLIQSEKGKGTAVQFRIPSRSAKHLHHLKPLEISGNDLLSE
jgi:signal transduction histidine kinase